MKSRYSTAPSILETPAWPWYGAVLCYERQYSRWSNNLGVSEWIRADPERAEVDQSPQQTLRRSALEHQLDGRAGVLKQHRWTNSMAVDERALKGVVMFRSVPYFSVCCFSFSFLGFLSSKLSSKSSNWYVQLKPGIRINRVVNF